MLDLKYPMYYKEKKRGKIQRDDVYNIMADEVDNRVFPIICKRNFIKEHACFSFTFFSLITETSCCLNNMCNSWF
jgi:hypothetical protein